MFRLSGLICLFMAVICGSLLFWTSQSVQRAETQLSQIKEHNDHEQETLRVLSAEWDYLNRPERLEKLTVHNLDMDEAHAKSDAFVQSGEDIPQPVVPVLPPVKPDLYREVSSAKPIKKQKEESPVIQNSDRQDFEKLINSVAEDNR